jgi:hypothetical protein
VLAWASPAPSGSLSSTAGLDDAVGLGSALAPGAGVDVGAGVALGSGVDVGGAGSRTDGLVALGDAAVVGCDGCPPEQPTATTSASTAAVRQAMLDGTSGAARAHSWATTRAVAILRAAAVEERRGVAAGKRR